MKQIHKPTTIINTIEKTCTHLSTKNKEKLLTPEGFLTKYDPLDPCDILSGKIPLSMATSACHTKSLNTGSSSSKRISLKQRNKTRTTSYVPGNWL